MVDFPGHAIFLKIGNASLSIRVREIMAFSQKAQTCRLIFNQQQFNNVNDFFDVYHWVRRGLPQQKITFKRILPFSEELRPSRGSPSPGRSPLQVA